MTCRLDKSISDALLTWFAAHQRDLPWRRERTPYRVWVSEVMLQQTQAATAIPYFEAFMERFPTLRDLAGATQEEVLKLWEGMGYYARARNLHRAAGQMLAEHDGKVPDDPRALRALPGIGEYVAGAILSLAYGRDAPALDSNGARVLARLCGVWEPIDAAAARRALQEVARALLPAGRAGEFNEALIELGALVCTPRRPACAACPLRGPCAAFAGNLQKQLPTRRPRRPVPHYDVAAAVIWDREADRVLIAQRRGDDMLGGLWEFPGGKREEDETLPACLRREIAEELGLDVEVGEHLLSFNQAYSHLRVTLHVYHCRPLNGPPRAIEVADWRWVRLEQLSDYPLSVADQRIARRLMEERRG